MSRKSDGMSFPVSFLWKFAILSLALLINVTLVCRLLWGGQSIAGWRDFRATLAGMNEELHGLNQFRADLSREIRLLQTDNAYVEKVIRQRLNYVRPNEILYLFEDAGQEDSPWTGVGADGPAE